MLKKLKDISLSEKIAFTGILLCLIGILSLAGVTIFTEKDIPSYWLSLLCSINMFFCALGNWKTQKTLAKIYLAIGSVILISALVLIIFS